MTSDGQHEDTGAAGRVDAAFSAVDDACAAFDVATSDRREVVRVGTSVLVRLVDAGVLARVDDRVPVDRSRRQVDVALALAQRDVPAVRLAGGVPASGQPHIAQRPDGTVAAVSLWRWEPHADTEAEPRALGELAWRLHDATADLVDEHPTFWRLDPLGAVDEQLGVARGALRPGDDRAATDLALLASVADDLRARWDAAAAACGRPVLVHGDLHAGNVLVTPTGPVLADLELAGIGPGPYDLAPQVVAQRRYGVDASAVAAFADAYGTPLPAVSGAFEVLVHTYELWVTLWSVANRSIDDLHEAEAERRLLRWRDPEAAPRWTLR